MLPGCHAFKECIKTYQKEQNIQTLTVNEIVGRCPNLIIEANTVEISDNLSVCGGNLIIQSITPCSDDFPIEIFGNVIFHDNVSIEGTLFVCDIVQGPNCNITLNFCNSPLELNQVDACPGEDNVEFITNVVIQGNLQVCDIVATNCPGQNINIGPNVTVGDTLFVCTIDSLGCPNNAVTIGPNVDITDTLTVCNINALGCSGNAVTIGPNVNITDTLTVCNINALGCPNNTVTIGPNVVITNTLEVCDITCPTGNVTFCDAFLNFSFFLPCPGDSNVALFSPDFSGRGLVVCTPNQLYVDYINNCLLLHPIQGERVVQFNNSILNGRAIPSTSPQVVGTVNPVVNYNLGYGGAYHTEMVVSMAQVRSTAIQPVGVSTWTTIQWPATNPINDGFIVETAAGGADAWFYPIMHFSTITTPPPYVLGPNAGFLTILFGAGFTDGFLINAPHRSGFNFQRWVYLHSSIIWDSLGNNGTFRGLRYIVYNAVNGAVVFGPTYTVLWDALDGGRTQSFDHIDNQLGTQGGPPGSGGMAVEIQAWSNDPGGSTVNAGGSDQSFFRVNFYS